MIAVEHSSGDECTALNLDEGMCYKLKRYCLLCLQDPTKRRAKHVSPSLLIPHDLGTLPCIHWQVYGGFTWLATFNTDLGDVVSLTADIKSMSGTAPVLVVSEHVRGMAPSFSSLDPYNSLPLGSATLTDLSDLSMTVAGLEEGVAYFFRVTASNYIGPGKMSGYVPVQGHLIFSRYC